MVFNFSPVLTPYEHQLRASQKSAGREAFAALMGMRTGKTKLTIDEWGSGLDGGETDLFITAPAGAYRTWEGQLKEHLPPHIYEAANIVTWKSGAPGNLERVRSLWPRDPGRPRVLLMNIEALSQGAGAALDAACTFAEDGRCFGAVDESTTIKNPESIRTRAMCTVAPLLKKRRILSGLPTPRSPLDAFSQFWFLDPKILGYKDYPAFQAHFAVTKKIKVGKRNQIFVVGHKNLDELHGLIEPHSFRVKLEDCYDVPKKLYVRRDVELTARQREVYDDLKGKALARMDNGELVSPKQVVTLIMRLHQVCCGHVTDDAGVTHQLPENRTAELTRVLDEYDGKSVIWCSYGHSVALVSEKLRKRYGPEAVAQFWGGNAQFREDDSRRFERDPSCRYMVATPGSGGRGRTWSMADLMIYYSNTDNLEHRDQSEERGSGYGKENPVTVMDFMSEGTVEGKIVKSLRDKIDMATAVLGDGPREWLI
jgi:SNF2 family DNA or RNA helicase